MVVVFKNKQLTELCCPLIEAAVADRLGVRNVSFSKYAKLSNIRHFLPENVGSLINYIHQSNDLKGVILYDDELLIHPDSAIQLIREHSLAAIRAAIAENIKPIKPAKRGRLHPNFRYRS